MHQGATLATFAILLFAAIAIVPSPVAAQATQTLTETFEDDAPLLPPNGKDEAGNTFYTPSTRESAQSAVREENAVSGNKSLKMSSTSENNAPAVVLKLAGDITCANNEGMVLRFWVRTGTAASGTGNYWIGFGDSGDIPVGTSTTTNPFFGVRVSSTGAIVAVAAASGSSATWATGLTGPFDVNVHITNCSAGIGSITSVTLDKSFSFSGTTPAVVDSFLMSTDGVAATKSILRDTWVDDISFQNIPIPATPPPVVGSDATAAFTHLLAFDAVGNGNHLVAREHNSDGSIKAVRTYNGFALDTETGNDETNVCNILGGVDALDEYVVYTACVQTGNTVDEIRIRSPNMGPPSRPSGCTDECPQNIVFNDAGANAVLLPTDLVDIHNAVLWQFQSGGSVGTDNTFTSFVYSTTDGEIGIWAVAYNELEADRSANAPRQFSTGAPQSTCYTQLSTGEKVIGAGHGDAATSFYKADAGFTSRTGAFGTWWDPHASMTPWLTNGQQYGQAKALACGGDKAVIGKSDGTIRVFSLLEGITFGALQCTASVPGLETRGLSISTTGEFFVAVDGTKSYAFNTTGPNCGLQAEGGRPSGLFVGVKMDVPGAHVWVGTRTEIARYEFTEHTCGTECEGGLDGSDTPGDGGGDGSGSGGTVPGGVQPRGKLLPPPSDKQIETFGSASAVDTLRATVLLVSAIIMGGGGTLAAAKALETTASLKVVLVAAGFSGLVATILGYKFGIVPLWFLALLILGIVAGLVAFLAPAFSRGASPQK